MLVRPWEDYLAFGVAEIREYGRWFVQVMGRMRVLLESLSRGARAEHRAAVEDEIARLDATGAEEFSGSVDLDRAGTADR